MKKLFVLAIAVLATLMASFASAGTLPYVLTELSQQGNMTRTRSLDGKGMLTESVCTESSRGSQTARQCVSQSGKLTKKEAAYVYASMRNSQAMALASAQGSVSYSDSSDGSWLDFGGNSSSSNGAGISSKSSNGSSEVASFMSSVSHAASDSHVQSGASLKAVGISGVSAGFQKSR